MSDNPKTKLITTTCYGCKIEMVFPAIPVHLTEWDGSTTTYWGSADSIWICPTCRKDPKTMRAARVAVGLPPTTQTNRFEEDQL